MTSASSVLKSSVGQLSERGSKETDLEERSHRKKEEENALIASLHSFFYIGTFSYFNFPIFSDPLNFIFSLLLISLFLFQKQENFKDERYLFYEFFFFLQITLLPENDELLTISVLWLPLFGWKNCVMKYTWPQLTPITSSILRTDIHVYVLADDLVTIQMFLKKN